MQVLMLTFNVAYTGGATFYRALHLSQGLAQRGHRVTLIASSPGGVLRFRQQEKKGVQMVEAPGIFPSRWRHGYDAYETLRRILWLSPRHFDIVHAFDNRPVVIYPALVARRRGSRLVMDWCDWFGRGGSAEQRANPILRTLMHYLDTYYEEAFRQYADATTVINSALEARARRLGIPAETIMRLPNGADIDNIRPLDKKAARDSLGLPQEGKLLGYMGSLFSADAGLLSQAFARVRAIQPKAHLLMMGNPKTAIPVQEGVQLTGFLTYEQLNHYLAACDILLLPLSDNLANRGRWPSKIGDYFAAGRPTVACAVGDIQEILLETGAGVATSPNPDSFAGEILRLLDNPAQGDHMGANGRQAAEMHYNWATLVLKVETLYQSLLQ